MGGGSLQDLKGVLGIAWFGLLQLRLVCPICRSMKTLEAQTLVIPICEMTSLPDASTKRDHLPATAIIAMSFTITFLGLGLSGFQR